MPPNHFESEVESFLEGSHGDRTHIKRADHPRLHHYAGHDSKKFAQQGLVVGVSVTKFAQRSRNSRKSAFSGVLGEFCTGLAQECRVLGELCRGPAAVGVRGRTLLRRALGSWAPLLAVLTL